MLTLCGLSPCVLDVIVSPAEVAELISVPFGAGKDSPVALYKFVCMYFLGVLIFGDTRIP